MDNVYYSLNNKYNYIITIIDHFSKYADSFLLENKKQDSLLNAFSKIC